MTQAPYALNLFAAGNDQCHGTLDVGVRRGGTDGQTQRTHGGGTPHATPERLDAEAAFEFVEAVFHSYGIESERLFGGSGIAEATTSDGDPMLARQRLDTLVGQDATVVLQHVEGDDTASPLNIPRAIQTHQRRSITVSQCRCQCQEMLHMGLDMGTQARARHAGEKSESGFDGGEVEKVGSSVLESLVARP